MVFKRKVYEQIEAWKIQSQGETALLVEGARRIGKSTIVEEFAKNEYDSYILVDFNEASPAVKALFEDLMDLDRIFLYLQTTYRVSLKKRKSVIIFDEVQQCPKARQAIKYLVKDGRYDYIETGSLISIRRNVSGITIPSEEVRIQMFPMDYEEFRWALGDEVTMPLLRTFWEQKKPLGAAAYRTASRDLRLYMLVGGMPQAVNAYLSTRDLRRVDSIKRNIVRLYADDFNKLDVSGRLSNIYLSIPALLSRNVSRYVPSSVVGQISASVEEDFIQQLGQSRAVNIAYHVDDPNVGMGMTLNMSRYKLFASDTGLFITLAFWDKDFTENIIYEKLLSDKLSANLGYVYENLVAQMLVASGNKLYYHTWLRDEKHYYETDFLLSRGNKIVPIEVKSSGYATHASLDAFCKKYSSRIGQRYLVYAKDLRQDAETTLLPICMLPCLGEER